MRKYLLGSVVAAAALISFSFVILPRIAPRLNAARAQAKSFRKIVMATG